MKKLKNIKIILASSSPRRNDLLKSMGLAFDVLHPKVDEVVQRGESPKDYVKRNSISKAEWALNEICKKKKGNKKFLIIAADTIVLLGREILEKPKNENDAVRMLSKLSGRIHRVVSGLSVILLCGCEYKIKTITVESKVLMKSSLQNEIKSYVATKEPMDKAGSYAVQGVGAYLVKKVYGSYSNVVGLPLTELFDVLDNSFGIKFF